TVSLQAGPKKCLIGTSGIRLRIQKKETVLMLNLPAGILRRWMEIKTGLVKYIVALALVLSPATMALVTIRRSVSPNFLFNRQLDIRAGILKQSSFPNSVI